MSQDSRFEIPLRIARYAYDRLTFAGPASAVVLGTAGVYSIAALEGLLQLETSIEQSLMYRIRFVTRYASFNTIPSLIWATQKPSVIVASSSYLQQNSISSWPPISPKRKIWIKILCSCRGALAGSLVLSNVMALTTLWRRAREDYAERIQQGREPPLMGTNSQGCRIRLAGVRSSVTELSLKRHSIWPVYEEPSMVKHIVHKYGRRQNDTWELLPRLPVYWQVNDGEYSKAGSWEGFCIPEHWLFSVGKSNRKLLYLEADATAGYDSALALQPGEYPPQPQKQSTASTFWFDNKGKDDHLETVEPDLDLKEVAQGFSQLASMVYKETEVIRVLLVDPTVRLKSGGGRTTSVRGLVDELALADIIVDARASILHAMLQWLQKVYKKNDPTNSLQTQQQVVLETPCREWFLSIRSELGKHGYNVIDRSQVDHTKPLPPMFVYERSSANTVHTIRQYLRQGIVRKDREVCALLATHEELDLMKSVPEVGCICASDIHDRALEWVRAKCMEGASTRDIQRMLDAGEAW